MKLDLGVKVPAYDLHHCGALYDGWDSRFTHMSEDVNDPLWRFIGVHLFRVFKENLVPELVLMLRERQGRA